MCQANKTDDALHNTFSILIINLFINGWPMAEIKLEMVCHFD